MRDMIHRMPSGERLTDSPYVTYTRSRVSWPLGGACRGDGGKHVAVIHPCVRCSRRRGDATHIASVPEKERRLTLYEVHFIAISGTLRRPGTPSIQAERM